MSGDAHGQADAWLDDFFAHYYARRPVNATFIGIHDHDRELPDCSDGGIAVTNRERRQLRVRLDEIAEEECTQAQRHDLLLAGNHLDLQLMEDELPQFHGGNPSFYTGEAVFSVISLFQRDSEPLADRVEAAISRMRLFPEFLAQTRGQVREAPIAWTERAIREARAGRAYFGDGLRILANDRGIADPGFVDAAATAHRAFEEHLVWLENELIHNPSEDFACGRDTLDRYLALGHCLPPGHDASWVEEFGRRALGQARERMVDQASRIDPARSWEELLATLAKDHPTRDDYYATYTRIWNEARDTAIAHELVTWPDFPIEYVPIPRSDREAAEGLYYLYYRCPPPFGRRETHRYLVTPIEPEMPPEEQERRLRQCHHGAIKLNHVVHHGGLGHHVQNWNAFRAESRVGQIAGVDCASRIAMFCGGSLVEGWACYATELMEEARFLTPLEQLSERQTRLRMAARAVVDCAMHTGAMTLDEATDFYVRETAMSPAVAKSEAVKNSMFPGAAVMYLIGTDAIWDLRRAVQEREGLRFSLRGFHDRFLSFGAMPVALIGEAMTADDSPRFVEKAGSP
ncbi:MAG: DUF885 family protein [Thermomicrobiales bacterium]